MRYSLCVQKIDKEIFSGMDEPANGDSSRLADQLPIRSLSQTACSLRRRTNAAKEEPGFEFKRCLEPNKQHTNYKLSKMSRKVHTRRTTHLFASREA